MKRIKELLTHKKDASPTYAQPLDALLARDVLYCHAKQHARRSLEKITLDVPLIVHEMTRFLALEDNLKMEGVLRIAGGLKTTQDIRNAYDKCIPRHMPFITYHFSFL